MILKTFLRTSLLTTFTITKLLTLAQENTSFVREAPQETFSNIFSFEQFIPATDSGVILLHNYHTTAPLHILSKIDLSQNQVTIFKTQLYYQENYYPLFFLKDEKFEQQSGYYAFYYSIIDTLGAILLSEPHTLTIKGKMIVSEFSDHSFKPQVLEFTKDSSLIFSFTNFTPTSSLQYRQALGLAKWNYFSDSVMWKKSYLIDSDSFNFYYPSFSRLISPEKIVVAGYVNASPNHRFGFLLEINTNTGQIQKQILFPQNGVDHRSKLIRVCTDSENNIYVTSVLAEQEDLLPFGIIFKLSENFELLWAKKMIVENFFPARFSAEILPDQSLLFVYYAEQELPVIVGKINPNGELLWHKGFEFYQPVVSILDNGSIIMTSGTKYFPDGSSEPGFLVAKTDTVTNIDDCPQLNSCLYLDTTNLHFYDANWIIRPATIALRPLDSIVFVPTDSKLFTSYCSNLQPPNPFFTLPDTVCAGICLQPDSTFNRLAHHVEWHIAGPLTDTLIADTTFSFCFDRPGNWTVTQRIWLLGCEDEWTHLLTVLPDDLHLTTPTDTLFCSGPPAAVRLAANRTLASAQWLDGADGTNRTFDAPGTYALTFTDGYCIASDTFHVRFLDDEWPPPQLAFDAPEDSVFCPALLPYRPPIRNPYGLTLTLDGQPLVGAPALTEPGLHVLEARIEHCTLRDSFTLRLGTDTAQVFLPNAFSPNDDGFNDFVEPQGLHFTPLRMRVFDRWGNLLWQTTEPPFRWNGNTARGLPAPPGIHVVELQLWNDACQTHETRIRDVLLVR